MKRREFLISSGLASLFANRGRLQAAPEGAAKLARIAVCSWSFHTLIHPEGALSSSKPMDILDYPEMIADRFHVHNLDINSPDFLSAEPSYIKEFKGRLAKTHSKLVNVLLDYDELWEKDALSSPDPKVREQAISLYKKGIDLAAALGSPSVRCDPGNVRDDPSPTIESYRALIAYAKPKGMGVIVENHGGISANPEKLVSILKASGARALPDIGNFPDEGTRERGLRLMYPLAANICHAKISPARYDLAKYVRLAKELSYKGLFSAEAGGRGDPYQTVQQILDVLMQTL